MVMSSLVNLFLILKIISNFAMLIQNIIMSNFHISPIDNYIFPKVFLIHH